MYGKVNNALLVVTLMVISLTAKEILLFLNMDYRIHIESDPGILLGKPVVKGTRITVELILQRLYEGASIEQLIVAYPSLKPEHILSVLAYAYDVVSNETIIAFA